jgi:hypothetical protein
VLVQVQVWRWSWCGLGAGVSVIVGSALGVERGAGDGVAATTGAGEKLRAAAASLTIASGTPKVEARAALLMPDKAASVKRIYCTLSGIGWP